MIERKSGAAQAAPAAPLPTALISLKMCEYLVSPSLIQQFPLDDLPDTELFDIQHVADSILHQKPSVLSQNTYWYPPNTVTTLRALPPHQPLFCVSAVQQQHGRPACSSPHLPGGTETHLSAQQESASV